jgi:hypothetical protein
MRILSTVHLARVGAFGVLASLAAVIGGACSGSNNTGGAGGGPITQTGQSCTNVNECYPNLVDGGVTKGTVTCLTQVTGGYCTHTCGTDADCCAIAGECTPGHPQVCAPFESTGQMYCFLSCEASVVGSVDATTYCQDYADAAFTCRSTGGGQANRHVCLP